MSVVITIHCHDGHIIEPVFTYTQSVLLLWTLSHVKVCSHGGVELGDPDSRDRCGGPVTATTVSGLISGSLRGVATRPNITEYCMYTVSPESNSLPVKMSRTHCLWQQWQKRATLASATMGG